MKVFVALLFTSVIAKADCVKVPALVSKELQKIPQLAIVRKTSETACQAVGMCSSRVQLRQDGQAFIVECVSAEEWAEKVKILSKGLPPEM